jgi:hypothetical protein
MDTISGFSGKSYEKIVQRKDPGNRENGVHDARVFTGFFSDNLTLHIIFSQRGTPALNC